MSQEYGPGGILLLLALGPIGPLWSPVSLQQMFPLGAPGKLVLLREMRRTSPCPAVNAGAASGKDRVTLRCWGQKGRCRCHKEELQHFLVELPPERGRTWQHLPWPGRVRGPADATAASEGSAAALPSRG